ncbi:hypothetical protein IW261DRAFT_826803 [Armillaria novae-zelandiae]|uniref:Uncharacterized protein n=1 Tax=Armillaria novae-zelandiae TaxID=153914 RepID=A0AA39NU55_9AGAR|nr:hypothetical protein IW261DRAFT_826803 [Armillaria novae-zelandiae]
MVLSGQDWTVLRRFLGLFRSTCALACSTYYQMTVQNWDNHTRQRVSLIVPLVTFVQYTVATFSVFLQLTPTSSSYSLLYSSNRATNSMKSKLKPSEVTCMTLDSSTRLTVALDVARNIRF